MLPEAFRTQMKSILGDGYDAFERALCEGEAVRALRINPFKCPERDAVLGVLDAEPLSYDPDGYVFRSEGIGRSPVHHGGAIYVQDPGAMSAIAAVPIERGWRAADFCAAPGGKSAQIAAAIGEEGILYSNEYVSARAKILVGNTERLGLRSQVITNVDTAYYAKWFDSYFDFVAVDVPCSGEGMFRKNELALTEWSEDNVNACVARAREILDNAAGTVRAGGLLLFSTCTFNVRENEEQVADFLERHPDYELTAPKEEVCRVTAPGIGGRLAHPEYCRRFYPHISPGEGQFLALMRRKTRGEPTCNFNSALAPLTKAEKNAVSTFLKDNLDLPREYAAAKAGECAVLIKEGTAVPPFGVYRAGVALGEIRGERLVPHHQLFSAFGDRFFRKVPLDGREAEAYLHGEEIAKACPDGYCVLTYRGIVLGGGKASGGRIKNHYPKGLRNN